MTLAAGDVEETTGNVWGDSSGPSGSLAFTIWKIITVAWARWMKTENFVRRGRDERAAILLSGDLKDSMPWKKGRRKKVPGSQRWQHLLLLIATGAPSVCVCWFGSLFASFYWPVPNFLSGGVIENPKREKKYWAFTSAICIIWDDSRGTPLDSAGQQKNNFFFFLAFLAFFHKIDLLIYWCFSFVSSGAEMVIICRCICTWTGAKSTSGRRPTAEFVRCRPSDRAATATLRCATTAPNPLWCWPSTLGAGGRRASRA